MKYALITGGSRGIGAAICKRLAKHIPVIINYNNSFEEASKLQDEIVKSGGDAELLKFDVSNEEEVIEALSYWEATHKYDYIAYLINNAGITIDSLMYIAKTEDWQKTLDINLSGHFFVTRYCLKNMQRRGYGGRIINMTSTAALMGSSGQVAYSASKAGIIGMTQSLALEVASRNITVNAIAPGFIHTDMTKDLPLEEILKMIPMRRFGNPDEIAGLVQYLISEDASYITGQVFKISGGL
jgi:3-oxoacyl-[acyl-carrier protein] reductase